MWTVSAALHGLLHMFGQPVSHFMVLCTCWDEKGCGDRCFGMASVVSEEALDPSVTTIMSVTSCRLYMCVTEREVGARGCRVWVLNTSPSADRACGGRLEA